MVHLNPQPGFLCNKGRPLGWDGGFGKPLHLGNGCNLINWQDLGSEYQGIGWVRNFRLIPILAGGPLLGGRTIEEEVGLKIDLQGQKDERINFE